MSKLEQNFAEIYIPIKKFLRPGQCLNRTRQHWDTRWYSTGSGSDRAPIETPSPRGARSLPRPVLYQCRLVRFSARAFIGVVTAPFERTYCVNRAISRSSL